VVGLSQWLCGGTFKLLRDSVCNVHSVMGCEALHYKSDVAKCYDLVGPKYMNLQLTWPTTLSIFSSVVVVVVIVVLVIWVVASCNSKLLGDNRVIHEVSQRGMKLWILSFFENICYEVLAFSNRQNLRDF
jgi:hypothetical protein